MTRNTSARSALGSGSGLGLQSARLRDVRLHACPCTQPQPNPEPNPEPNRVGESFMANSFVGHEFAWWSEDGHSTTTTTTITETGGGAGSPSSSSSSRSSTSTSTSGARPDVMLGQVRNQTNKYGCVTP